MHNLLVPKNKDKVKPLSPRNEEGKKSYRNQKKIKQKEDTQVKNTSDLVNLNQLYLPPSSYGKSPLNSNTNKTCQIFNGFQ